MIPQSISVNIILTNPVYTIYTLYYLPNTTGMTRLEIFPSDLNQRAMQSLKIRVGSYASIWRILFEVEFINIWVFWHINMTPTSLLTANLKPLVCSGYRFQSCVLVKCTPLQSFFPFIQMDYIVNVIMCDITAYKTCLHIDYSLAFTSPTSLTLTQSPSQSFSFLNSYQLGRHFGLV